MNFPKLVLLLLQYHYSKTNNNNNNVIKIKSKEKSWIDNKSFPVLSVRYEDLELETYNTFIKILEFINSLTKNNDPVDKDKIKKCIENCSFDKMKKEEKERGFAEAIKKRTLMKK